MRTILEAIDIALSHRIPFYAYCMPGCDSIAFGAQTDNVFTCGEWFKIVPFDISSNHSTKIIYKQINASELLTEYPKKGDSLLPGISEDSTSRSEYMQSIGLCIEELQAKKLDKVVLSKVITKTHNIQIHILQRRNRSMDRSVTGDIGQLRQFHIHDNGACRNTQMRDSGRLARQRHTRAGLCGAIHRRHNRQHRNRFHYVRQIHKTSRRSGASLQFILSAMHIPAGTRLNRKTAPHSRIGRTAKTKGH